MSRATTQSKIVPKSTLYRLVFDAVAVRYVVAFMFIFFVAHPAVPVSASEDVPVESIEEVLASEPESEVIPKPVQEETFESEQEQEESDVLSEAEVASDSGEVSADSLKKSDAPVIEEAVVANGEMEETSEEEVGNTVVASEKETHIDEEAIQDNSITSSSTNIQDADLNDTQAEIDDESEDVLEGGIEDVNILLSTSTEEAEVEEKSQGSGGTGNEDEEVIHEEESGDSDEDVIAENGGTSSGQEDAQDISETETDTSSATASSSIVSTKDDTTDVPAGSFETNSLNAHQFSDTECISVGDGSFYCSELEKAPEYVEDGVYSAPDADGDMEIYVIIGGKTTQITHNTVDDASPYYDGLSNTIVWHSMQNDRFQIAQYDVKTGETTYITDASYNNMEPTAYDDVIMWQAWIGNNWEVMLLDVNTNEVTQLTDNEMHDITPQMRDGYIMWQTQFSEGWKIALYDQKADRVKYIADSDGSKVANPRFVLVYDSTDKVGDVRTLGYDFGSGSSFTLGSLPAQMPEEIPKPDQTGETRALIQAKPSTKEGEVDEVIPVPTGTGSSTPESISEGDLVIQPAVQATTTEDVWEEIKSEDIIKISAEEAANPEVNVSHIDDVIILPFIGTTTDEVG